MMSVESVVGAGSVVVVDQTDGRHFDCTLSFDNPNDAFDCVSGVHVGSAGNMVAQGFRGNWCTGGDIGGWGVCYDGGASCNVENCSYTCTVPR
jgi:hypothetical protein